MAGERRSGWLWLGLWVLTVLMGIGLAPRSTRIYARWWQTRQEVQSLEAQAQALRGEQAELRQQLQRFSTPAGKEALAREKGWLKRGEKPLHIVPR